MVVDPGLLAYIAPGGGGGGNSNIKKGGDARREV